MSNKSTTEKTAEVPKAKILNLIERISDIQNALTQTQLDYFKEATKDDQRIEAVSRYLNEARFKLGSLDYSDLMERSLSEVEGEAI